MSVERRESFDHASRVLESGAEVFNCWDDEGCVTGSMGVRPPLRRESSLCNAARRVVGGEPLCLARALVSVTKMKTEEQPCNCKTHKSQSHP